MGAVVMPMPRRDPGSPRHGRDVRETVGEPAPTSLFPGRAQARAGIAWGADRSDHVDWPELMATIDETGAGDIWVTHGREEAVVLAATKMGRRARALALVGREDEGE